MEEAVQQPKGKHDNFGEGEKKQPDKPCKCQKKADGYITEEQMIKQCTQKDAAENIPPRLTVICSVQE